MTRHTFSQVLQPSTVVGRGSHLGVQSSVCAARHLLSLLTVQISENKKHGQRSREAHIKNQG